MTHTYSSRLLTIENYSIWTKKLVAERWSAYFINFMFKHLPKRPLCFIDPMEDEVCRVYSTLITRIVREPRKETNQLPIFFGCPDFPVWKREKVSRRETSVNGGCHYNGLCFLPPTNRLGCSLTEHFEEKSEIYVRGSHPLQRLHTTPMTHGDMTDYALKAFKSGRVSHDNVLILPRARSEL